MRILQICPRYYPQFGGVEEHVRNISERLAKKHEVVVATTDPLGYLPREDFVEGVKVLRYKCFAPNEAYYFSRQLWKYLVSNSNNFDLLHAHAYGAFPALYAALAKNNAKLFFTPHYHAVAHSCFSKMLHVPYNLVGRKIFEKADKVICVSNYEKNIVLRSFKIDAGKIVRIPNGLNLKEFTGLKKPAKTHRTILCVGRLEKYKGINHIIKIMPKLSNDITFEVVGSGPYKKHLLDLAKKLGVENRVAFFQNLARSELIQRYAAADLYLQLSEAEAFGISVLEALATGVPCIVRVTSALSEWVDNRNCFGITDPTDTDRLVALINAVIGKKTEEVDREYDWDLIAAKLSVLYESC